MNVRLKVGRVHSTSTLAALLLAFSLVSGAAAGAAQPPTPVPTVTVEQLSCLPVGEHGVVRVQVENEVPGTEVRIYFRRLHVVVEDFYWIEMEPEGGGAYWAALPSPEDEVIQREELRGSRARDEERNYRWAAWWLAKDTSEDRDPNDDLDDDEIRERASIGKGYERDWMRSQDLEELQEWLTEQRYEPAEYFAAVVAPDGRPLARSAVRVTPVTGDCEVELSLEEKGFADNLVVGETAVWQKREGEVFHWLCDGIVSRVDFAGILRSDETCRACVIAWWKRKPILAGIAGVGAIGGIVITDDDEPSPSPSEP